MYKARNVLDKLNDSKNACSALGVRGCAVLSCSAVSCGMSCVVMEYGGCCCLGGWTCNVREDIAEVTTKQECHFWTQK